MNKEEKAENVSCDTSCADLRNATNDLIGFFGMMEQAEESREKSEAKEGEKE